MKSCEAYQEMISRMLDGDLSKAEREELAEHVKRCPDCAAVYVAFRSVSEQLGGDLAEPPHSLHENVMAEVRRDQLRKKNTAHRSHRRWQSLLAAAACMVLIVAVGLSVPRLRKNGAAAPAEAPVEAPAAAQMAEQALLQEAEEEAALQKNDSYVLTVPTPAKSADMAAAEEPAAEELQPEEPALGASAEKPLVLTQAQSEALIERMTYDKLPLEAEPDLELYLLYWRDGEQKSLTVFVCGAEALYVFADGDSFCRIEGGTQALLELLKNQ